MYKIGKVGRELFATLWGVLQDEFSNLIVSFPVHILRVAVPVYIVARRLLANILIFLVYWRPPPRGTVELLTFRKYSKIHLLLGYPDLSVSAVEGACM